MLPIWSRGKERRGGRKTDQGGAAGTVARVIPAVQQDGTDPRVGVYLKINNFILSKLKCEKHLCLIVQFFEVVVHYGM